MWSLSISCVLLLSSAFFFQCAFLLFSDFRNKLFLKSNFPSAFKRKSQATLGNSYGYIMNIINQFSKSQWRSQRAQIVFWLGVILEVNSLWPCRKKTISCHENGIKEHRKNCTKIYSRLKGRWRTFKAVCFSKMAGNIKFYIVLVLIFIWF